MSQTIMQRLRSWIAEQGLDVFLIAQPQSRYYVSGWFNEDLEGSGLLLVGQQQQIVMTNPLYAEVAQKEAIDWQIEVPPSREYASALARLAQQHNWHNVGFESRVTSYWDYEQMLNAGNGTYTLHPMAISIIDDLRQVKQPHELELLKRAIAITDETFAHLCNWIQPGMTEKEVDWEASRYMISLGADGPAFGAIIASGPNGSLLHNIPSQRAIQTGELITIDMGARYKGYCADMTRTICLGEPTEPRMREIFDSVLHAMKICEAGIYAGIACRAADALARNALEVDGLAQYYVHSTGHGVGLQAHEGVRLSPRAPVDMTVPAGAIVTVEPGVYIPSWGGVRVEDCVLIKEDGVEVLTQSSTELVLQR